MQPDPTSPLDLDGSLLAALLGRYGEACVVADQEDTKLRHDEAEAAYEAIKAQHSTLLAALAEAQRERDEAEAAGFARAVAIVRAQADLPSLVHFDRPSDFRKGVLSCLAALAAAVDTYETQEGTGV